MNKWRCSFCLITIYLISMSVMAENYFPGTFGDWVRKTPVSQGVDTIKLQDAIEFAIAHESLKPPYTIRPYLASLYTGPEDQLVGPIKNRGPANGLIIKNGYVVGEYGDTHRVDMIFSVTKSFLSTMAALAVDDGLISNLNTPVYKTLPIVHFTSERHQKITWHHLLWQTSEWRGRLWGKSDVADRRKGKYRELQAPGTFWEYNDVRVNLTAYALMLVHQKPLPQVLKMRIMNPIGCSDTWSWNGYSTSKVMLNGKQETSVSGGGHWGGGLWINTEDAARFGYLFLREGLWNGKQLFSKDWIKKLRTPSPQESSYGLMWWVNNDEKLFPETPRNSYAALGHGTNMIWIWPEKDVVAVVRWMNRDRIEEFIRRLVVAF